MGASSGAMYRKGTVNLISGNSTITGVGTSWLSALIAIAVGDYFTLDMKTWYEVISVDSDTGIVLDRGFEGDTANSVDYGIGRNTSGTLLTRIAGQIAVQFNQKQLFLDELRTWLNSTNATENLTDSHGLTRSITTPTQIALNSSTALAQMTAEFNVTNNLANGLVAGMSNMTEVEFEANRQINREKFDYKSGFVEFGKTISGNNLGDVNEGLWCNSHASQANACVLGGDSVGSSNTDNALLDIAGVVFTLSKLNASAVNQAKIRFPSAPNGTVTYDSATGSVVDFTKDIDPKYGDIASTVNEAVSRAFEGNVKNGDFRLGDDGSWTLYAPAAVIVNGRLDIDSADSRAVAAIPLDFPLGTEVTVTIEISNYVSGNLQLTQYGTGGNDGNIISDINTNGVHTFKYNTADMTSNFGSDNRLTLFSTSGGWKGSVDNISLRPVTNEVVTKRVDLAGIEFYPEQITPANPEVYPKGMIQSAATSMSGVTTKSSTTRPDSYYAVFDGDTDSSHQNVDWFAATNEQRAILGADPSNNIVTMANGDVVQWKARQRTIAGAGNGDWGNIDSTLSPNLLLAFDSSLLPTIIEPQGVYDTPSGNYIRAGDTQRGASVDRNDPSIWYSRDNAVSGYDGECYFLVLATVERLNQGAYHPSFNELGTGRQYDTTKTSGTYWYSSDAYPITSMSVCFNEAAFTTGQIGGSAVGRPDGRFYDAIYASGQGGVIDHRLSISNDIDRAISQRKSDDKSGVSRGCEQLAYTIVGKITVSGSVFSSGYTKMIGSGQRWSSEFRKFLGFSIPSSDAGVPNCFIIGDSGTLYPLSNISIQVDSDATCYVAPSAGNVTSDFQGGENHVVISIPNYTNLTVSGEFNVTEVIGDPANILLTPDLKDGWVGYWNPTPLDNTTNTSYLLTRKSVVGAGVRTFSTDLGATWVSQSAGLDTVINAHTTGAFAPNDVVLLNYTTNAKITKESVNPVVYRGEDGLGSVFASDDSRSIVGSLLSESLANIVTTNSVGRKYTSSPLISHDMFLANIQAAAGFEPSHTALLLEAPTNNSPAVKSLWGTTEVNGQLFPVYWFTELQHNGTDWGDDSLIHVNDNTTTMTDLNGNTVKVGTAIGVEPIGWATKL